MASLIHEPGFSLKICVEVPVGKVGELADSTTALGELVLLFIAWLQRDVYDLVIGRRQRMCFFFPQYEFCEGWGPVSGEMLCEDMCNNLNHRVHCWCSFDDPFVLVRISLQYVFATVD